MENKEAIKDKILSDVYYKTFANNQYQILPIYSKPFYRNIIHEAMDLFYASQNEELRKSNNEMGLILLDRDGEIEQLKEDCAKLKSTIDDKNKEIALLNETIVNQHNLILSAERRALGKATEELQKQCAEKDKEIERLNGLIEDAHNSGWRRGYSLHTEIGESLQQFKSENNL